MQARRRECCLPFWLCCNWSVALWFRWRCRGLPIPALLPRRFARAPPLKNQWPAVAEPVVAPLPGKLQPKTGRPPMIRSPACCWCPPWRSVSAVVAKTEFPPRLIPGLFSCSQLPNSCSPWRRKSMPGRVQPVLFQGPIHPPHLRPVPDSSVCLPGKFPATR